MVVVEKDTKLSERRTQTSSEVFPDDALASIRSAAVPASVFDGSTKHMEVGGFDATIADGLSKYEYEGDATGGYNPNCKLWSHQGFNYSVDLLDFMKGVLFIDDVAVIGYRDPDEADAVPHRPV